MIIKSWQLRQLKLKFLENLNEEEKQEEEGGPSHGNSRCPKGTYTEEPELSRHQATTTGKTGRGQPCVGKGITVKKRHGAL